MPHAGHGERERCVDPWTPSVARIYDYFLGGKDNYETDRQAGDRLLTIAPEVRPAASRNRAALGRAVRYAASHGVRQILDIGSGLPRTDSPDPAMRPLHEQARLADDTIRTVYVDNDPVVLTHNHALLTDATVVDGDLYDDELLDHPILRARLDLGEPVALVLGALLHFVDHNPEAIVARFVERLAPGSLVVISHATAEQLTPDRIAAAHAVYKNAPAALTFRTRAEVESLFGGLPLVEPGIVYLDEWHPELAPPGVPSPTPRQKDEDRLGSSWLCIGVARVPETHNRAAAATEAGVYEYLLGGRELPTDADVNVAREAIARAPETVSAAWDNRAFVQRTGRELARRGVRQFIDLGCGYPTHGPLHEAVLACAPDARVVYVDYDPAVAAFAHRNLDMSATQLRWITGNLRRPWEIVDHPELCELIDWERPVAVVMAAVLHFVPDEPQAPGELGVQGIVEWWRDRMAVGSYLVLSHASPGADPEGTELAARAWRRSRSSLIVRSPAEVDELFIGFELLPPGLVPVGEWGASNAAEPTDAAVLLGGVGQIT